MMASLSFRAPRLTGGAPLLIGLVLVGSFSYHCDAFAQQSSLLEFEVVSVKRSVGGQVRLGGNSPGTFIANNFSAAGLIMEAYGVRSFQISGGPRWLADDKFDIQAKYAVDSEKGQSIEQQRKDMDVRLERLLGDRFQLRVHAETKTLPIYILTVAEGGVKVHETNCSAFDPNGKLPQASVGERPVTACGSRYGNKGINRTLDWAGTTMADFARWALPNIVGRPVIDKTELTGQFDLHLEWTPDQATSGITGGNSETPREPADDTGSLSIFTAVQEQMGLRLKSGRGPVEVIVVDHIERPSDN